MIMSFMFNPYPYNDPVAVNRIQNDGSVNMADSYIGNKAIGKKLTAALKAARVMLIDGYASVPFDKVREMVKGKAEFINVAGIYKTAAELKELFAENLPMDLEKDPVLLFGKLFKQGYTGIFDDEKLAALVEKLEKSTGRIVVYGNGALAEPLRRFGDVKIWIDVTPKQAVLNIKNSVNGKYRNFGADEDLPFKVTMRRCYYVDFELGFSLRAELLRRQEIDYYIASDDPGNMKMMTGNMLHSLISRLLDYPIRQRPVYLEGIWGGYLVQKERHLPKEMKNCAWVFDLIPMEVSTVIIIDGVEFEVPYYVVVASCGEKLMGAKCVEEFHGYFPIRFNYDDTFHSSGSMSIQLHPGEDFLVNNCNEPGRQDESYYIVAVGQDARTNLGLNQGIDPDEFVEAVKRSEKDHTPIDYRHYVHSVESKPGLQVMIPSGTIHGSGQNQVILEIGSLTVGSYTYKMYDYLRKDMDGVPRPIHSYYGSLALNRSLTEEYVEANLVNGRRRVIREEGDGQEIVTGECDQLYFSLRNLKFGDYMTDDTAGDFNVLALVDGEDVTVRSIEHPEYKFDMKYLDIVVIPASFGRYELINNKPGTWTTIHKTKLKR